MIKHLMAATFVFASLTACNNDSGSSSPAENSEQALRDTNLQGRTFWSACSTEPLTAIATGILTGDAIKASRTGFGFEGAEVTRHTRFFPAADCSGESAFTFREIGTFEIQSDRETNDGATFIDMNGEKLHVKIDSEVGASVANSLTACKANDWKMGDDREVTAAASEASCYAKALPRMERNIYLVESNTLYLGSTSDAGRDGEGRPTQLDRTAQKYVAE